MIQVLEKVERVEIPGSWAAIYLSGATLNHGISLFRKGTKIPTKNWVLQKGNPLLVPCFFSLGARVEGVMSFEEESLLVFIFLVCGGTLK